MKTLKCLLRCKYTCLFLALIAITYSLVVTLLPDYKSVYSIDKNNFNCKLINYEVDGNKLNLTLKCKEKILGTYYIKTKEELYYLKSNLKLGIEIELNGNLKEPNSNTVFHGFNYKTYLYNNKIYYLMDIEKIVIKNSKINFFYNLKNKAIERADLFKTRKYMHSFILGNTQYIEENILNSYRFNGISHLFAISGLHISVLSNIFKKILNKFINNKTISYIIIFILLFIYSFITGFSPSILRAILFFVLLSFNKIYKLNIKTIDVYYLVLSILLFVNPFNIFNLGFILSFIVSFFLIQSSEITKSNNYFISLLKVSIISTLCTIPISIYYFGYVSLKGILLNTLYIPYVTYIVFPLSLITFLIPSLELLFNIATILMEKTSLFFNKINLVVYFPIINVVVIIVYLVVLLLYIKNKNIKYLIFIICLLAGIKLYPYLINNYRVIILDQTTPNMIQRISGIFERNPLISKEIKPFLNFN